MEFLGQIEGIKFKPISDYNGFLKNNASFDVDSNIEFENILNKQTDALQNTSPIKSGITLNTTSFDSLMAQNPVQSATNDGNAGDLLKNLSNSIGNGLGSVDGFVKNADRAQEAFATGENVSVHDVMIAAEKASLNMQLAVQMRNKIMTAYNEINSIRV